MKKFATIAFALVLSASLLAGCRGGSNTDMTTMPTNESTGTTSTAPGARSRIGAGRENPIMDPNAQGQIQQQCN